MTKAAYTDLGAQFDSYFGRVVASFPNEPANLYEPVSYFLGLGGKRIRPLLTLIAADCFKGEVNKALPAASAIELFHNFSLIHDDIMDNAPLRRGKQTVHEKWNSNIGILSGDVLLVKAYEQLNKSDEDFIAGLNILFSRIAREICEGQQYDMDFEKRKDVTIGEYLEMIRLKTAVLLGCCLQMGAICAGAGSRQAEVFYAAGENLGIAFQLTDDHLDVFGDAEKVGKQSGGDIISNKKTWLLIKALEVSGQQQRNVLQDWINKTSFDPKEKVAAVKNIFTDLKLESILKNEIEGYYQKAFEQLRSAGGDKGKTEEFIAFISTLVHRQK